MEESIKDILAAKEEKKDKRGPRTPHQLLAIDIAESFGKLQDRKTIALLMGICKKYPLNYIRQIWDLTRENPRENPLAYFLALLKKKADAEEQEKIKKLKIVFLGTGEFARLILQNLASSLPISLVITQPDRPEGRKKTLLPPPVKKQALFLNLPLAQPIKIKEFYSSLKKIKPDLIIMADYGQIIPENILNLPRYGVWNIHPSLLPKYRGPSPLQTAILNQDKCTGISIILTDKLLDHGPIIAQKRLKIGEKNYPVLRAEAAIVGAQLLLDTLPLFLQKKIKPLPQKGKPSYTKIFCKKDGKINWQHSAKKISAQIRALYPWPGTWCQDEKERIFKIIKGQKTSNSQRHSRDQRGKIIFSPEKKLKVICGWGELEIKEIQPAGKKIMTAKDFLNGYSSLKKFV